MTTATTTPQQSNPFIKDLASSDRKTRDKALASLRSYLHRTTAFSALDFLKLWKGLFFSIWMSDKPLTQQRLARDLADLLNVLQGQENFLGFVDAFWKTMAREWGGIDALRMDKFLYLVRCYVRRGFESVSKRAWGDKGLVEGYLRVLEAVPLDATDGKIPDGLRFHVVDVYVGELDEVDTERDAPLEKILAPLRKLGRETRTRAVRDRVREALNDERLVDWQGEGSDESTEVGREDHKTTDGAQDGSEGSDDDEEFGGFGD